ncbi:heavy metal-associated domain containing protein [Musa troglodytarum]|uniref:Heavy metal-associated domain containing protein n=1 Tax=Musa troglodytarum TaxID=320322 RepID=A0A9E7HAB8_9LILI|nr:heavy metal-associated domain containing protein [Musa troglodytarum]
MPTKIVYPISQLAHVHGYQINPSYDINHVKVHARKHGLRSSKNKKNSPPLTFLTQGDFDSRRTKTWLPAPLQIRDSLTCLPHIVFPKTTGSPNTVFISPVSSES